MKDTSADLKSVSDKIIDRFLVSLDENQEFKETAERLRKTVLEDDKTSEKFISKALFGEDDS